MKKITLISFLLFGVTNIYSQNITNTLGASGLFSIKDGSTTFLTLSQATRQVNILGSLRLENTTNSTTGVLFKGANRFLHNYSPPGATGVNTFVGVNSGNFTMSGTDNSASYNTAVGHSSLSSLITGNFNSAFGSHSLLLNTYGFHNSAFGTYSIFSNTLGSYNSAFGVLSMYQNTTGSYNSAFGHSSLSDNSSGTNNSAFGSLSLVSNQTGHNNSAFGYASLYYNTLGYPNSAYGSFSLHSNTTGFENTALGYKSLYSNTTGWQNTAVGDSALHNNIGNYNTALGYGAGSTVTTGYNLTLLGIGAIPSSPTAIDQITLGNIFVNSLRCNVQTITSLSDSRDKKNITDLTLGLDFITILKPRQFNWDKRDWYEEGISDGTKMQETPTAGFIAQEFDEVQNSEHAEWLNLVLKDNPDKWEATYGNLLPVVVKAIQELKEENDQLKSELEYLKKEQLTEIQNLRKELVDQLKLSRRQDEDENENIKFSSAGN